MIKAVIFDCFGVLTTDTWKAYLDGLDDSIDKERLKELNHLLDAGIILIDDFARQVSDITGEEPDFIKKLLNPEIVKNTPLMDYIKTLKNIGLKTAILSNVSNQWIRDKFLTQEETQLFDEMILSFEVHLTKPDPRIFELACDRLGVQPKDIIFIDDSEYNCDAARLIGMRVVLYDNFIDTKAEIDKLLKKG